MANCATAGYGTNQHLYEDTHPSTSPHDHDESRESYNHQYNPILGRKAFLGVLVTYRLTALGLARRCGRIVVCSGRRWDEKAAGRYHSLKFPCKSAKWEPTKPVGYFSGPDCNSSNVSIKQILGGQSQRLGGVKHFQDKYVEQPAVELAFPVLETRASENVYCTRSIYVFLYSRSVKEEVPRDG